MRIITIEKLFGDHDIKIDLDQKLNIMIGENGIGKSTVFGNKKLQLLAIKNTIASTNLDHFINEFSIR